MRAWEEDLGRGAIGHHEGNGSWGSYQRGDALCGCAGLPYFPCPWPCQSAGDQISKLIALLGKVFSCLPECVIVCTCVFATQSADVLGA